MKLIAKVVVALSLLTMVAVSFFIFSAGSKSQVPGARSVFYIEDFPRHRPKPELFALMQRQAEERKVNLYLEESDKENLEGHRFVYSFIGDQQAYDRDFPDGQYPAFNPDFSTTMLSWRDNDALGITGMHRSSGSVEQMAPLFDALRREGVSITFTENNVEGKYGFYEVGSFVPALVVLVVALALTLVYSVAMARKKYAVQQISGYSRFRIVLRELLRTSGYFVALSAVVFVAGTVFLGVYNGWAAYGEFLGFTAGLAGLLYVGIVVVQGVALAIALQGNCCQALKGKKPFELLSFAASISYAMILVVGIITIPQNLSALQVAAADAASYDKWREVKDDVKPSLAIGVDMSREDSDAADPVFGRLVAQAEADNKVVYAKREDLSTVDIPGEDSYPEMEVNTDSEYVSLTSQGSKSVRVNNPYLRAQAILDVAGNPVRDLEEREATAYLLLPEKYQRYETALQAEYKEYLNGMYRFARERDGGTAASQDVGVEVIFIQDNQQAFTYGDRMGNEDWLITDPAIAVVPAASHILPLMFYGMDISVGYVTFTDRAYLERKIDEYGVRPFIYSIDNAAQKALDSLALRYQELRDYGIALLFAIAVLICAIAILCILYADRSKVAIFVRTISGWSFIRKHYLFLLGILGMPLLVWGLSSLFASVYSVQKVLLQFASLALVGVVLFSAKRHRGLLLGLASVPAALWGVTSLLGTVTDRMDPLTLAVLSALPVIIAALVVLRSDRNLSVRYMKEQS